MQRAAARRRPRKTAPSPPAAAAPVVTLRALDTEDDGKGGRRLPGALGHLPAAVQEVIVVGPRGCRRAPACLPNG